MRRIRQVCAAIAERRWLQDLNGRRMQTVALRTVCAYISMTVPVAEGAENSMLASAMDISLGEGTEPVPQAEAAPAEPAPGSYERMQALFGGSVLAPR